MRPAARFYEYLTSAYSVDQLRRHCTLHVPELVNEVSWSRDLATVALDVVAKVEAHGLERRPEFWEALVADRPGREADVRALQRAYGAAPPDEPQQAEPSAQQRQAEPSRQPDPVPPRPQSEQERQDSEPRSSPRPSQTRTLVAAAAADPPESAHPLERSRVWLWVTGIAIPLAGIAVSAVVTIGVQRGWFDPAVRPVDSGRIDDTDADTDTDTDSEPPPAECDPGGCPGDLVRWRLERGEPNHTLRTNTSGQHRVRVCVDADQSVVYLAHTGLNCPGTGNVSGWCKPSKLRAGEPILSEASTEHQIWRPGFWESAGTRVDDAQEPITGSFCVVP